MIIERRKPRTARIGIFGVGHDTYWGQFDGLLEELMSYHEELKRIVESNGVEVIDFGMIDNALKSYEAVKKLKAANLDLIFCNMLTYATSSTWGIIQREMDIPIVLVALQPLKAMDYTRASTYMQLVNDNICSLPEFVGVSVRMGKKVPPSVIGTLYDDPKAREEIGEWCRIACVLHDIKGARIGQMGHVLESMLDMHTDPTAFTAQFGIHIVQVEPDDVMRHYRQVSREEIERKKKEILSFFDTPDPKSDPITEKLREEDLIIAAKAAVALDRFIEEKQLDGMAYYYEAEEGSEMRELVTNFIVGNSLLSAAGFPMCGELDLKTCVAMMIMDSLGIGGSFAEFHPIDFNEDFILVGHDGPHHINIADDKPVLRSLKKYHGKPGSGASVEFKIKQGPITMLCITVREDGKFKFIIAEGESREGPIPPTGNSNTRGHFSPDAVTFLHKWLAEGPTHHYALGVGHHASTIKKIADALGIEAVIIEG
ncbi:MAG: L-arabinose isomerase family protein [Caldicoprobacterales bacterium]|jgi:L-arabinose isomerase|nr:arabinose isomerase [Clostridiales bacterium]